MKDLSLSTKIYLMAINAAGGALFISNVNFTRGEDPLLLVILCLIASFLHIYKVVGATNRSHYTFSFLIYGFTFARFGLWESLLVILVSNIAEWIWNKPPWYIQLFNISNYFISIFGASLADQWMNPTRTFSTPSGVLSLAVSMAIFTFINHFLLGVVLWLARGENFKVSRMMDFFPFIMDLTVLLVGCTMELIWDFSPYAILLFLFPLYLLYSSLRIPALERETELDPKTGVYNSQHFMQHLAKELDRANRFDRPLTVMMLDLDLLRNINNTYGHLAGDEVLVGIAQILKRSVREYDLVARFGGEEFSIMLPETNIQQAYQRAEFIRHSIEETEFSIPTSVKPIRVTISIGLSERESFSQSIEEIIHQADAALYHSKLSGRNRSFAYSKENSQDFDNAQAALENPKMNPSDKMTNSEVSHEYSASRAVFVKAPAEEDPKSGPTEEKIPAETTTRKPFIPIRSVNLYIIFVAILAAALYVGFYRLAPGLFDFNLIQHWPGLITCLALVIIAEIFSIDLFFGKGSLSTSAVPMLAGTLLYGPVAGAILSATYAIVVGIKYRSKFNRYIFNFFNQLISISLYSWWLHLFPFPLEDYPIYVQSLVVVLAALTVFLANSVLISFGMGMDLGQSPALIWKEQYAWMGTIYMGIGLIAAVFLFGLKEYGVFGALLTIAPLLLLRISQKQYVDRTREFVSELKEKNFSLQKKAKEIDLLNNGLLDTLAEIIDLRDPYVAGHSKQVMSYATNIAESMGLNPQQVEMIRRGGLLHDIGKLGISMEVLAKSSALSMEEFNEIKRHPHIGARLLEKSPSLRSLIPIVRHHHERYNGEGYPDGLSGHEIPIEARIVSVADAIEAMESNRPYRKARPLSKIIAELRKCSGTQFDPSVVAEAINLLENKMAVHNASVRQSRLTLQVRNVKTG